MRLDVRNAGEQVIRDLYWHRAWYTMCIYNVECVHVQHVHKMCEENQFQKRIITHFNLFT